MSLVGTACVQNGGWIRHVRLGTGLALSCSIPEALQPEPLNFPHQSLQVLLMFATCLRRTRRQGLATVIGLLGIAPTWAQGPNPAGIDWQRIETRATASGAVPVAAFSMARTETTVGQFRRFAEATRVQTLAERRGGGEVYEAGWVKKDGWNWRTPFGGNQPAADDEPAVHITFDEAQAFCRWAGGNLPTDAQWVEAAYTERRAAPPAPFAMGKSYPFPVGDKPAGAQCLDDCGPAARTRAIRHGARLLRGDGHARAGSTLAGVNGLFDMGGNAWEWIDEPAGAAGNAARRMRGGSWWYGQAQMRAEYVQSKPGDTTVVYIGFRCAADR
jgi:formylglycine-generating enzyme